MEEADKARKLKSEKKAKEVELEPSSVQELTEEEAERLQKEMDEQKKAKTEPVKLNVGDGDKKEGASDEDEDEKGTKNICQVPIASNVQ